MNPQLTWLRDPSGNVIADKIYPYEQLAGSWPELWANIGFREEPPVLPRLNYSEGRRKPEEYFSANTINLVQDAYREDFEILRYSAEPYWLAQ